MTETIEKIKREIQKVDKKVRYLEAEADKIADKKRELEEALESVKERIKKGEKLERELIETREELRKNFKKREAIFDMEDELLEKKEKLKAVLKRATAEDEQRSRKRERPETVKSSLLPIDVKTKTELTFILKEVAELKTEIGKSEAPRIRSGKLADFLSKKENKRLALEELEKELKSVSVFGLRVAFSPPEKSIDKFKNWIERELKRPVVLDLTVDPGIIGGAVVEFDGKWGDFSLSKKMKELNLSFK